MRKTSSLLHLVALSSVLALGACAAPGPVGLDLAAIDSAVAPGRDFYLHANGKWLAANPVPEGYGMWGAAHLVMERNEALLRDIVEEAAETAAEGEAEPGSFTQLLGDFYASGMDTARIEADGAAALAPWLERIDAAGDVEELEVVLAALHRVGAGAFFAFGSLPDFDDSSMTMAAAFQGGLGLPERDYYLRDDEGSAELREGYVGHVARMLGLLGTPAAEAARQAALILALETELAERSYTSVQMRDPGTLANKVSLTEADAHMPHFSWTAYLRAVGAPEFSTLNLTGPDFFTAVDDMLTTTPIDTTRAYLRWHLLHSIASELSTEFVDADFDFYGVQLSGIAAQRPRWKRVLTLTSAALGEVLGQAFVERAFSPEAKQRAETMVANILAAFRSRLARLDWMGDATRVQALAKLDAFGVKLGFPDVWRDYAGLALDRESYAGNVLRVRAFDSAFDLAKIGRPVNPDEWGMPPQMVNAYYNPFQNEIVFPAAILQPPFFCEAFDDPLNYGAMGAIIGHEITHGFDDSGSQFDAAGNLRNWWTPEDLEEFRRRAAVLVAQFSAFEPLPDLHVNGELTLGENIADLGGLIIAYEALQGVLERDPGKRALVDGYTPEQRFFLAWAQAWRMNAREEMLRMQVNTDSHSPSSYRAIGPLQNMPEFARAFGVNEGEPMVRSEPERVRIW